MNRYKSISAPKHPRTNNIGYIHEHILVAEKALGRFLKSGEEVHHVDGNGFNNSNNNLVICNKPFHFLLHYRTKALKIGKNVNFKRCWICKEWDDPNNMKTGPYVYFHSKCRSKYRKERRAKKIFN